MAIDPGDWTINGKLAQLDPALARSLELQHFKPIDPDAVAQSSVAKSVLESYVSSIISLARAAQAFQAVAAVPGNFSQSVSGRGASAGLGS
jgi:hypothetical protein